MPSNAFEFFMGQNNARCVALLERNENVSNFVQALLEHLVQAADSEGVRFESVQLSRPTVGMSGDVHAKITFSR